MAITVIAHTIGQGDSSGATTGAMDSTSATQLPLAVAYNDAEDIPAISDSKGNIWTPRISEDGGGVGYGGIEFFTVDNPIVGSGHTFSATGTPTYASLAVLALAGAASSGAYDQETSNSGSGFAMFMGLISPSEDDEIVITALACHVGTNANISSGYTISDQADIISGTSYGINMAYFIQTTATPHNAAWSWTGSVSIASSIVATFKVAGAVTSAIKTITGLAVAAIKTVNGLAIASMKTRNGLA